MNVRKSLWGILLIGLGVLLIFNNIYELDFFTVRRLWPLFILVPGLIFEIEYFSTKRNPGILVPGGILTTLGILFFFEVNTGFVYASYTWPIYPLAVAIGLFQLYLHYGRPAGLLVPVFILGANGLIPLVIMFLHKFYPWVNSSIVFPVILIILGIFVLIRNFTKK